MADEQKVREAVSVPPRWYSLSEIEHCLERMNYSPAVIAELAPWFFRRIHAAFNKGYQKAQDKQAALSHASATAEECAVGWEAVAWLEVEPGISFERAVSEHGMLIHSMLLHVGRRKPTKRQDANGLFPLFGHPPLAAEDARDAERYRWLRDLATERQQDVWMAHLPEHQDAYADKAIEQAMAGKRGG